MAKSNIQASTAEIQPTVSVDASVRSTLFVSLFLISWITFHPYPDLSQSPQAVTGGGDLANQIGFTLLFVALGVWTMYHEPQRLLLLLRPTLIVVLTWCVLSVLASWDPSTAARRLVFALIVVSLSAMALSLPKNVWHFSDLLAAVVLIVLAACYFGVAFLPQLSTHQATDFLEPEHVGEWRGVFSHKNEAGAAMVLFIFVGIFVVRTRSIILGASIVCLSVTFLIFTGSKTAILVLPLSLVLTTVVARIGKPTLAAILVVTLLLIFNLFTVGTVVFAPIRNLVETFMSDATFTGRTEIWQLAIQAVSERPILGYGYATFWGTPQVVYGMGEKSSWVNTATDAHNAYLNLAVTIGIPGMIFVTLWVVVLPILDFYRGPQTAHTIPLQMLFLRVCVYTAYASCFESSIFQQFTPVWFFCMTSMFGLRYLAKTGLKV
jgi:O-antigen ligase